MLTRELRSSISQRKSQVFFHRTLTSLRSNGNASGIHHCGSSPTLKRLGDKTSRFLLIWRPNEALPSNHRESVGGRAAGATVRLLRQRQNRSGIDGLLPKR